MFKASMFLVLISLITPSLWGQSADQSTASASSISSSECAYRFTSGSARTLTQYCVSGNGNIVQFSSPAGFEFLNASQPAEGYGVCDYLSPDSYYDYASDNHGWGPATVTNPNPQTMKFVRTTLDGVWQLTQTITQIPAGSAVTGSVKIAMTVKNQSNVERTVVLVRYANVDANGSNEDDNFLWTRNSAVGAAPALGFGLGLTTNTFAFNSAAFVQSTPAGPNPCDLSGSVAYAPFTGDGSIGMHYSMLIPAGASRTVRMTYKPI